jgi:uncharacterized protein YjiS (DUF1127 family)
MTDLTLQPCRGRQTRHARPAIRRIAEGAGRWLVKACTKRRTRMRLADLDDHLLADIAVTRAEAASEAARSWQWRGRFSGV